MKKLPLLLLATLLTMNVYAQVVFESGYFIDNSGQKVECLIRNVDWSDNPTEFQYKLSEGSEINTATIESVKEFGVDGFSKYIKSKVKIDRSSDNIYHLSHDRNPIFKEEELFLRVLVEGKANLYFYEHENLSRFFFSIEDAGIEQLVFKRYRSQGNKIGNNQLFRQQLWSHLQCPEFTMNKVEKTNYTRRDLVRYFVDFNECHDQLLVNYTEQGAKTVFNLNIRPGLNYSSLFIENPTADGIFPKRDTDFGSEIGFRFGIEAELILPFHRNKWGIIMEPTYHHFKSEKETSIDKVKVNYTSIEIPIGVRHYFFLNEKSKIFINGSFIVDVTFNSIIEFEEQPNLPIRTAINLGFGLGYKYNDKFGLELRYHTARDVIGEFDFWVSEYRNFSVILGYTIL